MIRNNRQDSPNFKSSITNCFSIPDPFFRGRKGVPLAHPDQYGGLPPPPGCDWILPKEPI
jgi:hypothetical protein